jgi:hypothetical protein
VPPASCPICEDERQYVNWKGQQWLTREALAERHRIVWHDDLGIVGIGLDPGFAIGQRALIVKDADGCVMWDCIPLASLQSATAASSPMVLPSSVPAGILPAAPSCIGARARKAGARC